MAYTSCIKRPDVVPTSGSCVEMMEGLHLNGQMQPRERRVALQFDTGSEDRSLFDSEP